MTTEEIVDKYSQVYSPSEAQRRYCEEHFFPWFAPIDRCPNCNESIYSGEYGYTAEYASTHLITGCPYCHFSFVE